MNEQELDTRISEKLALVFPDHEPSPELMQETIRIGKAIEAGRSAEQELTGSTKLPGVAPNGQQRSLFAKAVIGRMVTLGKLQGEDYISLADQLADNKEFEGLLTGDSMETNLTKLQNGGIIKEIAKSRPSPEATAAQEKLRNAAKEAALEAEERMRNKKPPIKEPPKKESPFLKPPAINGP